MLFTTTTQFVALALCLVAGWFFGLASHGGGRKWKTRYADEREAHAGYRKQGDAALVDANRRIAELERENDRLARAGETVPVAAAPVAAAPTIGERLTGSARPVRTVRPAYPAGNRPGWFDFGDRSRV
ncbi:hypothetical protein MC45_05690 [Sphingomonas taxi]|uniref:Uncharacterized protein n=1 Tax=Sphingomonas taxi TaxID=1549858 RepID=A0A097EEH4_9SPHN|nr:hypothetical protein [Sphingomonas taxi]AIT05974.1 hypothetical protein MC45_05690 [Sphingomonas taxi]